MLNRRITGIAPGDPLEFFADHDRNFIALRLYHPADDVRHELEMFKTYVSEQGEFAEQKELLEKIQEMEIILQQK